jgi:hypothetical protein
LFQELQVLLLSKAPGDYARGFCFGAGARLNRFVKSLASSHFSLNILRATAWATQMQFGAE